MSFDTYRVVDFSPVKGLGFVGQREDGDTARVSLELDYNQLVLTPDVFDGSRDKMYEAVGKFLGLLMQIGMIATVEEEDRDIVMIKYNYNDALSMNEGMGVDQPIWCTFEEIEWIEACRDDKCEEMTAKVNCRYDEEDEDEVKKLQEKPNWCNNYIESEINNTASVKTSTSDTWWEDSEEVDF